jgi:hypothetical protein
VKIFKVGFLVSVSIMTGCASITGDSMQSLSISTETVDGKIVSEAKCSLKNEEGEWEVTTPEFVNVHKSSSDLFVNCKKENHADGGVMAISRAGKGMYGNILFGGGIGAIIDHNKGTAYNYPDSLPVVMGKKIILDRSDQK